MTTQLEVLQAARKAQADGHDGLYTSRLAPLSVVRRLVEKGLMEAAGLGVKCDGDGSPLPSWPEVDLWRLTPAGERALGDAC